MKGLRLSDHIPQVNPRSREQDRLLTVCKRCWKGIFRGRDKWTWATGGVIGMVHVECPDIKGEVVAVVEGGALGDG